MKVYKMTNVFEEALDRIRRLYDEFEEVWVSYSGGKDSTVVYELTKIVAREKGRLPVKVLFVDQEAEYRSTVEMVKEVMYDPEVEPYWLQVPLKMFNATSGKTEWLECWDESEKDKWIWEKDPISLKENKWGTDRFVDLILKFMHIESKGKKSCYIGGVRTEESPTRFMGLTGAETYKGITWGKKNPQNDHTFTFYPIYDWSYLDVWKAIHDNNWSYNKIYDVQYSYGVNVKDMRVSNLHHETAIKHLFVLQEAEPETYQRLVNRLDGIDTAGKLGEDDFFIRKLPFMFKDWKEYRDYLLENLITNPDHRKTFRKMFDSDEKKYTESIGIDEIGKKHVASILANDYHGSKLANVRSTWTLKTRDYHRELKRNEKRIAEQS